MPYRQSIEDIVKTRIYGGNKCGHNKYHPFLSLTVESDSRPPFLYSVAAEFKKYYDNPDLFPSLNHAFSERQQRSERREAVIAVMLSILEFMDLSSLRVGIPMPEGFQPLKLDILRRRTKLGPRRFERAIQTLRKAGILKVSDQLKIKTITGRYAYFPAVRRVNRAFFIVLGFGEQLLDEAKKATERLKERAKRLGSTLSQMAHFSLQSAAKKYSKWQADRQAMIERRKKKKGKSRNVIAHEIASFLRNYHTDHEIEEIMRRNTFQSGAPPAPPRPPNTKEE